MTSRKIAIVCSVSALTLITACSSNPPRSDPYANSPGVVSNASQYGNVSHIELVSSASRGAGGAVLGAVIGAVVGNQVGSGTGRAAATGLGAVGGAVIGNNIQKRNESDIYRVSVRLDDGRTGQFDYQNIDDLRVGDRVIVEGGQLRRV
jgi:outer membrane lipoprotein SlyB